MINKIILCILFIIKIVYSQNAEDYIINISDISDPPSSEKYPIETTCIFYSQIKFEFTPICVSPSITVSLLDLNNTYIISTETSDDQLTKVIKTLTSVVTHVDAFINGTIIATCQNGITKNYTMYYTCYEIKESEITIKVVKPKMVYSDLFYFQIFLQFDGLKCPLEYFYFENSYAIPFYMGEDGFYQSMVSKTIFLDNPSNQTLYFTISFASFNYTFPIDSYYQGEVGYTLTDYIATPSNIDITNNVLDIASSGDYPFINFKTNSTDQYPNFFFVNSSKNYALTLLTDSNSDGTYNYKTLFIPELSTSPQLYDYNFYSLENSKLKALNNYKFNATYPKYSYQVSNIKSTSPNTMNIASISFQSKLCEYNYITWNIYEKDLETRWPFGFSSGNLINYQYNASFYTPTKSINNKMDITFKQRQSLVENIANVPFIKTTQPIKPKLKSYNFTLIENNNYLVRIEYESVSGIDRIQMGYEGGVYFGIQYLISGDIFNGVFEFPLDLTYGNIIVLYDLTGNVKTVYNNEVYSTYSPYYFKFPIEYTRQYKLQSMVNIKFLLKDIQVSNVSVANRLTFSFSSDIELFKKAPIKIYLVNSNSFKLGEERDEGQFAKWNESIQLFVFDFIHPIRSLPGLQGFIVNIGKENIFTSRFFSDSLQLNVSSNYIDYKGPTIKSLVRSTPLSYADDVSTNNGKNMVSSFYWLLEIEDSLNGFKDGIISVRGSIDGSIYNFTLDPTMAISGDLYYGTYKIQIDIELPSIPQFYQITFVILSDTNGYLSLYEVTPFVAIKIMYNPFSDLQNSQYLKLIEFNGEAPYVTTDSTIPILTDFKVNCTSVDVAGNSTSDSAVFFEFSAKDIDSGLKAKQYPVVFITTDKFELLECRSKIVYRNETYANYSCEITIPYAFGFSFLSSGRLLLSVYGFINNGGLFMGATSLDLKNLGFQDELLIKFTNLRPIITSTSRVSNTCDGGLIIYGNCLKNSKSVSIEYSDGKPIQTIQVVDQISNSVIILNSGTISTLSPFKVSVTSNNDLVSNEIMVSPVVYNFKIPTPTPTPTPTTPNPTKPPPPFKCLGNPECGGPLQGYCNLIIKSCVCYSPWIGSECDGKVIINPIPPVTNQTNPSITIDTGNNGDSGDTLSSTTKDGIIYKSIISIVSLRELDFNDNQVNLYTFDKWAYQSISNDKFKNQYTTTITTNNNQVSDIENQLNVTVTLEWFENQTSIEFANQKLTMNPSSIKYTIELSKYPFPSGLNKLQLIMSASFQVVGDEKVCSNRVFGDTMDSGSNENESDSLNYIQIQIDNHSLYGRFIKRGIVDSIEKTIDNVLLDSSLNAISSSTLSQSFIGITIPNYDNSVVVDPDFSVLLNSNPVSSSSSDTSICPSSKSGLSASQLAGIIVGSVAFLFVAVIGLSYIFVKKYKDNQFTRDISLRVSSLNKQ